MEKRGELIVYSGNEPEALIVLGKGYEPYSPESVLADFWLEQRDGQILSTSSQISAMATALMYQAKKNFLKKIILSGGDTTGFGVSEAEDMEKVFRKYIEVEEDIFEKEMRSKDTSENAEFVYEILRREGLEKAGLMTVGYHLPRAKKVFEIYDIVIPRFASEDVLLEFPPPGERKKYEAIIEKWAESHWVEEDKRKEKVLAPYVDVALTFERIIPGAGKAMIWPLRTISHLSMGKRCGSSGKSL
jgi:uncharacterized SAM-binding protein YcdF (DUF218 family)